MGIKKTLALAAIAAALSAGSAFADGADTVLATIGNDKIVQADIDGVMASLSPQERAQYDNAAGREAILDSIIDLKVFARSAREQKLDSDERYKKAMASFEERLLATLAQEKLFASASITPTEEEAKAYYDEHKEIFQVPASIRASHILIRADKNMPDKDQKAAAKRASEILSDIQSKKITFEDAAKEYSADPGSRTRGGDLGFFTKGQMVPEFEKAAFALKKGEMTRKPIKSEFGYHIIKLTDTREANIRSFEEVKTDIINDLAYQKQFQIVSDARADLRVKYGVKITAPAAEQAK